MSVCPSVLNDQTGGLQILTHRTVLYSQSPESNVFLKGGSGNIVVSAAVYAASLPEHFMEGLLRRERPLGPGGDGVL